MAIDLKLKAIKTLSGKVVLKSGLHIGAGNTEMHIGGMDNPVVKHPHSNDPYIPGSSLKGKIRSLLELKCGLVPYAGGSVVTNKTLDHQEVKNNKDLSGDCMAILKLFGSSGAEADVSGNIGPTRLLFSDCYLDNEWKKMAGERRYLLTEEKSENSINRISGTATSPRFTERVPEGTIFSFCVTCRILKDGDEKIFEKFVLDGLKLLEHDALGGSGSRGYGRVKFTELSLDGQAWQETFDKHVVF
jgi:CRISPR-associated protein Csm3